MRRISGRYNQQIRTLQVSCMNWSLLVVPSLITINNPTIDIVSMCCLCVVFALSLSFFCLFFVLFLSFFCLFLLSLFIVSFYTFMPTGATVPCHNSRVHFGGGTPARLGRIPAQK